MTVIIFPSQCVCGHVFLERYEFQKLTPEGFIGFCWCGLCRTKRMVRPTIIPDDDEEVTT